MKTRWIALSLSLVTLASSARAATTFEYIFTDGYPLAISADGNAIAGQNKSDGGPFRWTRAGGRVQLGMDSYPITGSSNGLVGISADGLRVASTIVGPDSTYSTAGLWIEGSGWHYEIPPIPAGAGVIDKELSTPYSLSGDGLTTVGLLWLTTGHAHAFRWTQATGAIDLGSGGRSSRANGVNFDGSVVVGWDESPAHGYRCPAAWVNGQRTVLAPDTIGEAQCVTQDGQIAAGYQLDPVSNVRQACTWQRDGSSWSPVQLLGYVAGTEPGYGINVVEGISADATIAVGYCSFAGDPFSTTGFVWTPETGVIDVVEFLGNQGILPDPSFSIVTMSCVSPDGTKLVGYGRDTVSPYATRAFMIHLDRTAGVAAKTPVARPLQLAVSPNPIRSGTTLSFDLAQSVPVSLTIQDASGRLVRRAISGSLEPGHHQFAWDGRDDAGSTLPSGIYFSQLVAGRQHATSKLVLFR